MTREELWDRFWVRSWKDDDIGCIREAWDELVVHHLNIPRSLKDDPPKDGEDVIVLKGAVSAMRIRYHHDYNEVHAGNWTHWIPRPELPKLDGDEEEFDAWWSQKSITPVNSICAKDYAKAAWTAARKAK